MKPWILISCLLSIVYAKQALSYDIFARFDVDNDGKLSRSQFIEAMQEALLESVIFILGY